MRGWGRIARIACAAGVLSLARGRGPPVAACSAIVDHADSQCASDDDCARFPGTTCVAGGCAVPSKTDAGNIGPPPPLTTCTSTQDCLPAHGGRDWICRRSDFTCVSLVSQDCSDVAGRYVDDDVVLVGALLPLAGPHRSSGLALADAVRLGVLDFAEGLPDLDDAGTPRPIAVVLCDESDDVQRAARHLADDLGVAVVLGTADSATTLLAAHNVTGPSGQLLLSPRAGASLSGVSGQDLVWRTCPPDAVESAAIAATSHLVLEPLVKSTYALPAVRVALAHAADVQSREMQGQITSSLQLNGAPATDPSNAGEFIDADLGDPDDPSLGDPAIAYARAVSALTRPSALPDIVLLVGPSQAVTGVLRGIESSWPINAPRRPRYLLSSGLQVKELLDELAGKDDLRRRILGTAPGADAQSYANLATFLVRYRQSFADQTVPETFGAAQAYDALYTIAYAASVTRNADLVGADVLAGLRRALSEGAPTAIDVGPDRIPTAFDVLVSGGSIALRGASGPLAFTPTGDLAGGDVQVWCVVQAQGGGELGFQPSGLSYSASAHALAGAVGRGCGQ
jgi:ABC-type branched-subunit amino acid transport system substrate-binding protein